MESADFDLRSLSDQGPQGTYLTVDLEFPTNLHDMYRYFPPVAVGNMTPTWEMFGPLQQEIWGDPNRTANPTLLGTLEKVEKYSCHYRFLKEVESLGVVVTAVHEVQTFDQAPMLRDFINKCTAMRTAEAAKGRERSDRLIAFFKLMANSLYGKMVEDVRGRSNMRFAERDTSRYLDQVKQPAFINEMPINEDGSLLGVNLLKEKVQFDKPIPFGVSVLDLSKLLMVRFWYTVMMPMYGLERLRLLYTDTDSLIMEITTEDVNQDFKEARLLTEVDGRVRLATPADPEYDRLPSVATEWLDCSKYPAPPKPVNPDSTDPPPPPHPCTPMDTRCTTRGMRWCRGRSRTKARGGRLWRSSRSVPRCTLTPSRTPTPRALARGITPTTHAKGTDKALTRTPKDVDEADDHPDRQPENMSKDMRQVQLEDLRKVLYGEAAPLYVTSTRLVSKGHQVSTRVQERKALDRMNTKRYLLGEHGIESTKAGC